MSIAEPRKKRGRGQCPNPMGHIAASLGTPVTPQPPMGKDLATPAGQMKVIPTTWVDGDGRRIIAAVPDDWHNGSWTACVDRDGRREAALAFLEFAPCERFAEAQMQLDRYAAAKGWTPDPPLPEDDREIKPVRRNGKAGKKEPGVRSQEAGAGQRKKVPCSLVDPNPWQPRQAFDAGELAKLAASIGDLGLLYPPIARQLGGRYQIAAGERRLRACRDNLGWAEIELDVRTLDDRQMRSYAYAENAQRQDLNPIERARELNAMLDAGDAAGPTELARMLGVSQGHVSNLVRLLELPADWQARVISQEIPATHARALLPWAGRPAILKGVANEIERRKKRKDEDPIGSVGDFEGLVIDVIHETGRRVPKADGKEWDSKHGGHLPAFAPAEEEWAKYDVVMVRERWGHSKQEVPVALNRKAFDRDHAKHMAAARAAAETKHKAKPEAKGKAKDASKKPLTPAQQKKAAEKEAARLREQYEDTLKDWWRDAWCWLVAAWIRDEATADDLLRVTMLVAYESEEAPDPMALPQVLAAKKTNGKGWREAIVETIAAAFRADAAGLEAAARAVLAAEFWTKDGPRSCCPFEDENLVRLGVAAGIDFEDAWLNGRLGPLYGPYYRAQPDETHLLALLRRANVEPPPDADREAMIQALLAAVPKESDVEVGPPLPADLAIRWKQAQKAAKRAGAKK